MIYIHKIHNFIFQMKNILLIINLLFITSSLLSEEIDVLFQYKSSSGLVWKKFGKGSVQPKYEGEVLSGLPDGFGVLSFPFSNGKSVVGEWKNGEEWNTEHFNQDGIVLGKFQNGKWTLKWGTLFQREINNVFSWTNFGNKDLHWKYLGFIENMKPNGKGKLISPEGENYIGEFKDGFFDGHGEYTKPNGYSYVGRWKNKKQNGFGTEILANKDKYVGEFKNGKKHGQGKFKSIEEGKYTGEFKKGKKNGQGTFISPDGEKYVGIFKNGQKNGKGTLTSPDGSNYIGLFKNGKKNGKGTLTSPGGRKYVGEYKNGKKHGNGTFTYPEGKYEGKWKDGKFHGQGSFTFSNGNKGVGEFRENKPWNITTFDKDGNYKWKYVEGIRRL